MTERKQRKLIVSDVEATKEWLLGKPVLKGFETVPFLGRLLNQLRSGDIVVGTLPLVVAAQVCRCGAEYWHINFRRPRHQHRHLTADELARTATVERYIISEGERIA